MIKKKYISLLFLVSSVSLIGTGFSSWVIYAGEPVPGITSGTIYVDTDILDYNNYLYYDTSIDDDGIYTFSYSEFSFLTDTGNSTSLGQIKAYLILNLDNCKIFFNESSTLRINSILRISENINTNLNLFNDSYLNSVGLDYSSDTHGSGTFESINQIFINSNKGVSDYFSLTNFLTNYDGLFKLTLTYNFIITADDFEYYIAPYLMSDNISFSLKFSLVGI